MRNQKAAWSSLLHPAPKRTRIDCVFLTRSEYYSNFFKAMLRPAGIRVHRAGTVDEADFLLIVTGACVLLTDSAFLDGTWRDALRMTGQFHPRAASFVLVSDVESGCAVEALRCGASAVFTRPLYVTDLRAAIETVNAAAEKQAAA